MPEILAVMQLKIKNRVWNLWRPDLYHIFSLSFGLDGINPFTGSDELTHLGMSDCFSELNEISRQDYTRSAENVISNETSTSLIRAPIYNNSKIRWLQIRKKRFSLESNSIFVNKSAWEGVKVYKTIPVSKGMSKKPNFSQISLYACFTGRSACRRPEVLHGSGWFARGWPTCQTQRTWSETSCRDPMTRIQDNGAVQTHF